MAWCPPVQEGGRVAPTAGDGRLAHCTATLALGSPLGSPSSRQPGTLRRLGAVSCVGMELRFGNGYGWPRSTVPAKALTTACSATAVSPSDVAGNFGTVVSGRCRSANAWVRSPVVDRRHAERFGTSTPNRVSRKRRSDVWSKVVRAHVAPSTEGRTTRHGTRKPRPIGPAIPEACAGSGTDGQVLLAVPGGGVGGGTWSKKPPFSS